MWLFTPDIWSITKVGLRGPKRGQTEDCPDWLLESNSKLKSSSLRMLNELA